VWRAFGWMGKTEIRGNFLVFVRVGQGILGNPECSSGVVVDWSEKTGSLGNFLVFVVAGWEARGSQEN